MKDLKVGKLSMDRRSLLKGAGAATLFGTVPLVGCNMDQNGLLALANQGGFTPITHQPLRQPTEVRSVDGVLSVDVTAKYGDYNLAGKNVHLRSYDGLPVGQTLRVKQGDQLRLLLKNTLPLRPDESMCTDVPAMEENTPRGFNVTNMHVHGLHVSPQAPSDNILMMVGSGKQFQYVYDIGAKQPSGTFFYHAHFHGSVALQICSGLSGALIVEGAVDEIPEIKAAEEKVMVFTAQRFDAAGYCEDYATINQPGYLYTNGQITPVVEMQPGEVQRWRLVNATHNQYIMLNVEGHEVTVLGLDGNPVAKTYTTDKLQLVPGNRADILIKASQSGSFKVSSQGLSQFDWVYSTYNQDLAVLKVGGTTNNMPLYSGTLPDRQEIQDIPDSEITYGRRVEFGQSGRPYNPYFTLDNKPFSCSDPWQIPIGSVEEWEIYNQTDLLHPFHIHVNPFQVVEGGGVPPGTWLDTILLKGKQRLRIRTRFSDFDGTFVFHCHDLRHEDLGMMQALNVYTGPYPPTKNIT